MSSELPEPGAEMPNVPAKPYLKRKTKKVAIDKNYKVESKSKIDCW